MQYHHQQRNPSQTKSVFEKCEKFLMYEIGSISLYLCLLEKQSNVRKEYFGLSL